MKIMKVKTEDMLSDIATKVMTIPRHHVQKCGLRDLSVFFCRLRFSRIARP